ncbi:TMEM175 family protein [Levilactobacillus bambusae]|nr:TMEM175 family protein [Levilactobacillus bambusae]
MKKLKERLDAFSDAIIAIIITIMVLELPVTVHNGNVNFVQLFQSIGIYIVSFCFVADLWYQHAIAFDAVDEVPNKIVIKDLIFLLLLSLTPTLTRLMTQDTVRQTVMLYGTLYLLIEGVFRSLAQDLVHLKFTDKANMKKMYQSIYGNRDMGRMFGMILTIIVLAYFYPKIALVFFLIIPIRSFFTNALNSEEMQDLSQMPIEGQKSFDQMSGADKRKYSQMIRRYIQRVHRIGHDQEKQQAAWNEFAKRAQQEFNISESQSNAWFRQYQKYRQPNQRNRSSRHSQS